MLKKVYSFYYPFDFFKIKKLCVGKSGVYQIINEDTNFHYIGSVISKTSKANRFYTRFRNHLYNSERTSNKNLKSAIRDIGVQRFSFHILEFTTPELARSRENYYIKRFQPEYNILTLATSSLGYKHTDKIKAKMRKNYSKARKLKIVSLNKDKSLPIMILP